jgi:outer membrane protein OmpA-like peptidoglycan-associated protein
MSQGRVTRRLVAAVGVMSLFAAYPTMAQQTQQLPSYSTTYPIHFATGSAQLGPEDQDTIRAVASKMAATPALTATIIGKADTVGSAEFNEKLAEKRAQTVFEALVYTNKVPENRVDMHFTGERIPFASTADEQAELQNRVVAIILR